MHKLVVKIKNNKNYEMFRDILKHIDFIELKEKNIEHDISGDSIKQLFGIWKNRDIDLKKIRNISG